MEWGRFEGLSDLWLSEGVSAFVADGFLLQRLGKQSYDKELEHSRQIYNRFRTEGKDRPLDYTEWTTREDAGGEIPIHKGASFSTWWTSWWETAPFGT